MSELLYPEHIDFLNSLPSDYHLGAPNIVDESIDGQTLSVWNAEYKGDIYVCTELNYGTTECRLGVIAANEVIDIDLDEAYKRLINAAVSPVTQRSDLYTRMKTLMGTDIDAPKQQKPANYLPAALGDEAKEIARNNHFRDKFVKLSGIDKELFETLGLEVFRNEIVVPQNEPWLYLIANTQLNTKLGPQVLALRYHTEQSQWQHRLFAPHYFAGFWNAGIKIQTKTLNGDAHWLNIDEQQIRDLTLTMSEQRPVYSL